MMQTEDTKNTDSDSDEYLTLQAALDYLGVKRATLYNYVKTDKLKRYHAGVGNHPLFKASEVQALTKIDAITDSAGGDEEVFMNVEEVMTFLNIKKPTVYKYVANGKLTSYQSAVGKRSLFKRTQVEDLAQIR